MIHYPVLVYYYIEYFLKVSIMTNTMKLWLDDVRPMPEGYDKHVTTAQEAINLLKSHEVTEISLDHDLGSEEAGTGYSVACWIEQAAFQCSCKPIVMHIHSANPVGVERMTKALKNACLYWNVKEDKYLN